MSGHLFESDVLAKFATDGFVMAPALFSTAEAALLSQLARRDQMLREGSHDAADGEGGAIKLSLWDIESDDIYGLFSRSRRVVDNVELILGEEVYHYHSKMIQKEPLVGGAWAWHQDYGYWYDFGILYPKLVSCFIAVDKATRANGCLQVLRGSHALGRVNHQGVGDQAGADLQRVEQALKRHELVYCEMEPGDALFFDCNLLHRSDQNNSPDPRWSLICCYNAASNSPFLSARHADYHPLEKVDDDAILSLCSELQPKQFFRPHVS